MNSVDFVKRVWRGEKPSRYFGIEMHFLKENGLLNFASRKEILDSIGGRRAKFDSWMMHGSPVYHPNFAPLSLPACLAMLRTSAAISRTIVVVVAVAATRYRCIFDSRFALQLDSASLFRFASRHSGVHLVYIPPLRSRTSATRIYGSSALKASSSSSYPQDILLSRITYMPRKENLFVRTRNVWVL